MSNNHNLDNGVGIRPSRAGTFDTQAKQYEVPEWKDRSAQRNLFPPLHDIGSTTRSHVAPAMDRSTNRSRSPMNLGRSAHEYRSRHPPATRQGLFFSGSSRPQISYPKPYEPARSESPPRFALRSERTPACSNEPRKAPQPPSKSLYPSEQYAGPTASDSRLLHSSESHIQPRPALRVSPVPRQAAIPRENVPHRPSRSEEYTTNYERLAPREHQPQHKHTRSEDIRPTLDLITDISHELDLLPKPRYPNPYQSGINLELVPKPLNLKRAGTHAPTTCSDTDTVCEYLSLDELENLWQSQDMYAGAVAVPAGPGPVGIADALMRACQMNMAHIGPMSPDLADHPAFRNERPFNSSTCV